MLILPRINPDNVGEFPQFWDNAMTLLENWANGGGLDLNSLFGAGRFVDFDITVGSLIAGTGFSVVLPSHDKGYLLQNRIIDFPADLVITNIPSNKPKASDGSGGSYGFLRFDPEDATLSTFVVNWYDQIPDPDPVSEGIPCIGRVFTAIVDGSSQVTDIDVSEANYIQNPTYQRQLISSLRTRIELLESIISGGSILTGTHIPIAEGSNQSIKNYIDNGDNDKQNQIDLLTGGRDILPMSVPTDIINTVARMAVGVAELNPHAADRLDMAIVLPNLHGDGTHGSPNYDGPGNIKLSEDGRTFEPS